jgi:hypothetical protein
MVFARQYSEAEDSILIGCNVPIVAAILARKIYYPFGGPLFPNLFNIVVTPQGFASPPPSLLRPISSRRSLPQIGLLADCIQNSRYLTNITTNPLIKFG